MPPFLLFEYVRGRAMNCTRVPGCRIFAYLRQNLWELSLRAGVAILHLNRMGKI